MIVTLFPSTPHKLCHDIISRVRDFFERHDIVCVISGDQADQFDLPHFDTIDQSEVGLIISLGGDGALIRCAHHFINLDVPILGINLGHLGFMADVPLEDLDQSLEDFINGEYTIQNRLMIEGGVSGKESHIGINDFVIHRSGNPRLIEVSIDVDGMYVNNFVADGIIIAAPNGSTAYSLAAGGPILDPSIEAFVITPISPHTISNRPIVISSSKRVKIKYLSEGAAVEAVVDGVERFTLETGDAIEISRSKHNFKLINLIRRDFFRTVRTKLGWAGKLA